MPSLSFFVNCVPPTATSQGKGACIVGGKRIKFYKKKRQQQAENSLLSLLQPYRPQKPFQGPLCLTVSMYFPWRKSEKKSVVAKLAHYPISSRPDVDNLGKLIIDVMTTLGYWADDGQIASLGLSKNYSDEPGIKVVLTDALGMDRQGHVCQL